MCLIGNFGIIQIWRFEVKIAFWARIAPDLIICVCTKYLYTLIINIDLRSNMFVEGE